MINMDKKLQDKRETFVRTIRKQTKAKLMQQRRQQLQIARTSLPTLQPSLKFLQSILQSFQRRHFQLSFQLDQPLLNRLIGLLNTQYSLHSLRAIATISELPSQNVTCHLASLENHQLLVRVMGLSSEHCLEIMRIGVNSMGKRGFWRGFRGVLLTKLFIMAESYGMNREIVLLACYVMRNRVDPGLVEEEIEIVKRTLQSNKSKGLGNWSELPDFLRQSLHHLNALQQLQTSSFPTQI